MNNFQNIYRINKCSLRKILKDDENNYVGRKLVDVCDRANKIVIHAYQFLRLWVLQKYNDLEIIPTITEDIVKLAFKVLIADTNKGAPINESKSDLYKELKKLYDDV